MKDVYIFKRIEKKYMLNYEQYSALKSAIQKHLSPDCHGKSTVCSLYLDTPDFLLIRRSLEAKTYKEKLRIRSYGEPNDDSQVFLEIKKKFKGVVYKRRVSSTLGKARAYVEQNKALPDSQIMREIDYAMKRYGQPGPKMLIACEREAYFDKDDPFVRLTFDTDIRYRTMDQNDFISIQQPSTVLLEIKTAGGMPVWLAHALSEYKIYAAPFSKYGTAYKHFLQRGDNING